MKRTLLSYIRAAALSAIVLLPAICGARTVPPSVNPSQLDALSRMEMTSARPVSAAFHTEWGTPTWLSGRLGKLTRVDAAGGMDWLIANATLLRLTDPRTQLRFLEKRVSPRSGYAHLIYGRQEGAVIVWSAEIVLHVRPDGAVTDLTASYPPSLPVVLGALAPSDTMDVAGVELGALAPELAPKRPVRRVFVAHRGQLEMAWQFGLMWHDRHSRAFEVLASARDGRVLRRWTLIQDGVTAKTGSGTLPTGKQVSLNVGFYEEGNHYILHDLSRGLSSGAKFATYDAKNEGNLSDLIGAIQNVASSNGTFKDGAAVAAHYNLGLVHDYFKKTHGWNSWNGSGGAIESFVHVDNQLNNAYWHGGIEAMFFGDGDGQLFTQLATCLDVAGHELSHGVVGGTVGLVYENQSGALNEHIADFMAMMVDPPTGSPQDWWLGEDCMGSGFPTPFLRHIKDPAKAGQPGHGFDYADLPNTEDGDWGGVHVNSGIPNKISYLLATTLGRSKAEQIHFEILRGKYIGANATFLDFRNGWLSACNSVGGGACDNGLGAFDQVGITAQGTAPSCPSGASGGGTFGCKCPSGSPYNYSTGQCGGSASSNCGGVPASGVCEGTTLKQCVNGKLVTTSCSGGACLWSSVFGSYQCSAQADCGSVGSGGVCIGSQVKFCEGGTLKELDCAQYGKTCSGGQCVDLGSSTCTPACNGACGSDGCGGSCGSCSAGTVCESGQCIEWEAQECGAVTYEGECNGVQLSFCDNDILVQLDCGSNGGSCGFNDEQSYFDCVVPEGAEAVSCGGVSADGSCQGSVLSYCEGDALQTFDCAQMGLACGLNPTTNTYDCLGEGAAGCGDVTFKGVCNESGAVVFCQDEAVQTLQCNLNYQKCEYNLGKFFYDCVNFQDPPAGEEGPSREGGFCSVDPRQAPAAPWGPLGVAFGLIALLWLMASVTGRAGATDETGTD